MQGPNALAMSAAPFLPEKNPFYFPVIYEIVFVSGIIHDPNKNLPPHCSGPVKPVVK
jgi:hypothetical protein